jgi:DNA-binding MarR family transcriptional regulator
VPARRRDAAPHAALRLVPHLHRAVHRIGLWLESHPALGVTQAESHLLAHLAVEGPSTVAELHRALAHRRSTLTSVLDRLEERGLVSRVVSRRDRRSFEVRLTASGLERASRSHAALAALERDAVRGLTRRELERLIAALDRVGAPDREPDPGTATGRPARAARRPARRLRTVRGDGRSA